MISSVRKAIRADQLSGLNCRQRGERGSVLTEFVLVAPVMLLIAGSALRFYQELQAKEIGITFVREVATLAYNRCIDKTSTSVRINPSTNQEQVTGNPTETLNQIGECINEQVLPNFIKSWDSAKPIASGSAPITITVEAYRCDIENINPTTTKCVNIGKVICTSPGSGCEPPVPNDTTAELSPLRNRKIIAKVEFTMTPLAIFIPSVSSKKITYEATV
jgi:hypothetical protein